MATQFDHLPKAEREQAFEDAYAKACVMAKATVEAEVGYNTMRLPCGFAWVNVRPGNSKFANWLKSKDLASKAYGGGVNIWVHQYGQSYDHKMRYAGELSRNLATLLQDSGITASGRLD